jgi:hypothetical protein
VFRWNIIYWIKDHLAVEDSKKENGSWKNGSIIGDSLRLSPIAEPKTQNASHIALCKMQNASNSRCKSKKQNASEERGNPKMSLHMHRPFSPRPRPPPRRVWHHGGTAPGSSVSIATTVSYASLNSAAPHHRLTAALHPTRPSQDLRTGAP